MINSNILSRVFFVKYGNSVGTAFTIEVNNTQYLISAKHVFSGLTKADNIEIFHENKRKNISIEPIFCESDGVDVIAFKIPLTLSPQNPVILTCGNAILSQDVFFLGFPYNLFAPDFNLNRGFPFPIVKKGILSAMGIKDNYGNNILLIDGHNNKGFSGGPIVFFENNSRNLHIGGIISGYYIDQKDIKEKTELIQENSGLFYGYDIKYIIKTLENKSTSNQP